MAPALSAVLYAALTFSLTKANSTPKGLLSNPPLIYWPLRFISPNSKDANANVVSPVSNSP